MPLSIVLYKLTLQDETAIVINYREPYPVVIRSGVMPVVRLIERQWQMKLARSPLEAMLDQLYLNPSVLSLGTDFYHLFSWEIMTDPYIITELKLLDQPKMIVARCDGRRALEFWNDGRKPTIEDIEVKQ